MRNAPNLEDKWDREEWEELNAPAWMLGALALNPSYCGWGPGEDYMSDGGGAGWSSNATIESWADGPWSLDELNVCANFYFSVSRSSVECSTCDGEGYHPDARWISDSFYRHTSPFAVTTFREQQARAVMERFSPGRPKMGEGSFPHVTVMDRYDNAFRAFCEEMSRSAAMDPEYGGAWNTKITQDEADALIAHGRCGIFVDGAWTHPPRAAASINADNVRGGMNSHDAINRSILIETRCKRLGVPLRCPYCNGRGHLYTEPAAHLSLVLWMLHPRKGASRGLTVKRVEESDLPAVRAWLADAARQNAARFAKVAP